jgi:hypothetical protein
MGTRTRDLPACSVVPQPTTLPRAPAFNVSDSLLFTQQPASGSHRSWMNPIQILTFPFPKIHLHTSLPRMPKPSKQSL